MRHDDCAACCLRCWRVLCKRRDELHPMRSRKRVPNHEKLRQGDLRLRLLHGCRSHPLHQVPSRQFLLWIQIASCHDLRRRVLFAARLRFVHRVPRRFRLQFGRVGHRSLRQWTLLAGRHVDMQRLRRWKGVSKRRWNRHRHVHSGAIRTCWKHCMHSLPRWLPMRIDDP